MAIKAMIGHKLQEIELKKEINSLLKQMGKEGKYEIVDAPDITPNDAVAEKLLT